MSQAEELRRVLIVGATSAIAQETARCFAERGAALFLIGRDAQKLGAVADDLRVRGAERVATAVLDVRDLHGHGPAIDSARETLGVLDAVLIAHGVLPDQQRCEGSAPQAVDAVRVNYLSVISLLTHLAPRFEERRGGCIAVISSVAGDRGRRSNYVYGSAKAGLNVFLDGLRARLREANVTVLVVKPGFVDTPMTAHIPKNPLFVGPERVGKAICRAMERGRDEVYLPWFWRPIMTGLRLLPRRLFERLPL